MIQFRGMITEVAFRNDNDTITIKEGKRTSKIRVDSKVFKDFKVGETVTIVIEKETDMFGGSGSGGGVKSSE